MPRPDGSSAAAVTTSWHDERLGAVQSVLAEAGAQRVLDLGCGDGDFVLRLCADPRIAAVTALEQDATALTRLRQRLPAPGASVHVVEASLLDPPPVPPQDAAVLIEVIEHLDPADLSRLENVLFRRLDLPLVVVTTPNAEFNGLLGVPPHRFRHPDHRFEWDRRRFASWAQGVAARHGRGLRLAPVGGAHPQLGGASQMAVFARPPPAR